MGWVVANVMPYEGNARAWLKRAMVPPEDIDDLIQEAYCKLAGMDTVDHIEHPDGYFFQIVRNLLTDQIRRAKVVRIGTVGELGGFSSDEPSPEQAVAATRELEKVRGLIAGLPPRCREIIQLRKIEGVSQKEIARRLGLSESTVENEGVRGMRLIMEALRNERGKDLEENRTSERNDRARKLKRD